MANYELSGRADDDLTEIFVYSFRQFGENTAEAYLLAFHDCFVRLQFPNLDGPSITFVQDISASSMRAT